MTYKKARTVLLIGCALMGVLFFVGAALQSGAVVLLGCLLYTYDAAEGQWSV